VRDSAAVVPNSADSVGAEGDVQVDLLVEVLERADRVSTPVVLRWILNADVPFVAASVMLVLAPDRPRSAHDVAEEMGISVEDAARALHALRSQGYAREDKRHYEATDKGMQAHGSLVRARRDSLAAFVSTLSEQERRHLAEALTSERHG
jgi:hypothetical protein